jgi:hypothetical protein
VEDEVDEAALIEIAECARLNAEIGDIVRQEGACDREEEGEDAGEDEAEGYEG